MKNFNRKFSIFFAGLFLLTLTTVCAAQKTPNSDKSKNSVSPNEKPTKIEIKVESKTAVNSPATDNQPFLSELETAVIDEINQIRSDPQKYVTYLEEYKKAMKGNILYRPKMPGLTMIEGSAAIDDAINELKTLPKAEPLTVSKGLFRTANLQLTDLLEDSSLSHRGKNGSDLNQRLLKFGFAGINTAENIAYNEAIAREILMTMVLDDGLKSRAHRKNVFSSRFKQIGVACGVSVKKEPICVTVFADSFKERN